MAIIGIDLGTTNSLVSLWRDTGVELIPNALGEVLTPSVVSIDADKAKQWLSNGAQPTDTVRELLKKASVL